MKNLLLGALLGFGITAAFAVYDGKSTFTNGQLDACSKVLVAVAPFMPYAAAKCVLENGRVLIAVGTLRFNLDGEPVNQGK